MSLSEKVMMKEISVPIIGYMNSPYREKFGIPRQPNLVDVEAYIEMQAPYHDALAFVGIEAFSHLWLLWQFHDNKNAGNNQQFRPLVRPPRLGGNQKMGVFATRSMYRPAPIGLSVVKLLRVEQQDQSLRLYVQGSDLLDGTPIVDIKPYIHYSDAVPDAKSGYAQDQPERKQVFWSEAALEDREKALENGDVSTARIAQLNQVLALDPRPAYQDDPERVYGMNFDRFNIKFKVQQHQVDVLELQYVDATQRE